MEDNYLKEFSESFGNEMETPENPLEKVKAYLMQLYNSDKIQNGNPDLSPTLPGLQNMADKAAGIEPQGYANGGVVDNDFYNQLQQGTAIQPPQFDPTIGMPPTPPPVAPQQPLPAVNPIQQYLGGQRAQIGKYGPEQQLAVANDLINKRQSFGAKAPVALGGLADSIMQGVARAGSGGFADRIQGQQNKLAEEKIGAMDRAGTQNLAQVEATSKLDAMDPNSPVSKVAQQTWGALLAKNGFKPEQIAQMPASSIAALTGQTVEALKAESEAKMAAATLGLNTFKAKSEDEGRKEAAASRASEQQLGAAKTLAGRGMFKKITDSIMGDPGTELLEKQLEGAADTTFTPDVTNYAKTHGISPQQAQSIKDARGGH